MNRIITPLIEIAAASVFIVPLFLLYGKRSHQKISRTFFCILFAFYLTAVFALVGFPNIASVHIDLNLHLIPFAGMAEDFQNACLNVLLFIPFGMFLPFFSEKFRKMKSVFLAGLLFSLFIEISQIFTLRATDINDLITNVLGTLAGWQLAKTVFSRYPLPQTKEKELFLTFGSVIIITFFLQPFPSEIIWNMLPG